MTGDTATIATDHPIPPSERAVLNRLLDLMIPASPDGPMPSAGALDLYAERGRLPETTIETLREGLCALSRLARERCGSDFPDLDRVRAMALVDEFRGLAPAFFAVFVTQSAGRYYQHDRVVRALGLEPRPPWPEGNKVVEGDWSLLEPVSARQPLYRAPDG